MSRATVTSIEGVTNVRQIGLRFGLTVILTYHGDPDERCEDAQIHVKGGPAMTAQGGSRHLLPGE